MNLSPIAIVITLIFFSCHTTKDSIVPTNQMSKDKALAQYYWKLVELQGQKIETKTRGKNTKHILFNAQDKTISGFAGCNQLSGQYTISEGNQIRLEKIATTKMNCLMPTGEYEFLQVLQAIDNYTLVNNTLKFNKAKMATLATFEGIPLEEMQAANGVNFSTLWVNSSKVDCIGVAPMTCFQVQKREDLQENAWEYFYDEIEGLKYTPGYIYKLRVKTETLAAENVPADASSEKTTLVEILSKELDKTLRLHDIWVLQAMNGKEVVLKDEQERPILEIFVNKREILGKGVCNNYFGGIKKLTTKEIEFGAIGSTKMMCPNQETEDHFFQLLSEVRQYKIDDGKLSLLGQEDIVILTLKKVD